MLRLTAVLLCVLSLLGVLSAQTGNGTITGVVTDPTGAVVANAAIEVKNTGTGVVARAVSTDTGNYTVTQLPVGAYELTATVQGFKKYNRQGLTLSAAQVMRLDVPLEVGASSEAVTVSAESTLLKTENSELAHNVTIRQLENLPILPVNGGGLNSSSSGFRDPYSMLQLIPGTQYTASSAMTINGIANQSSNIVIEGQLGSNLGGGAAFTHQTQPSVDAIQEVAIQTSNFAAEFGGIGAGLLNITMRSGTNQYHGTAYDYAAHDALGAAQPYSGLKSKQRRHDYGGTLGGPVKIPKIYNGSNKTFFFFNFEQYRENIHVANTSGSVPSAQYRNGDFSQVICLTGTFQNTGCAPGTFTPKFLTVGSGATLKNYVDPLGNQVMGGQIFDPFTSRNVTCNTTTVPTASCTNGSSTLYRDAFPGNIIPATLAYRDPVAARILNLVPLPFGPTASAGTRLDGNYQNAWLSHRTSQIPSFKIDHQVSTKGHLSYYYGNTVTESQFSFPNGNSVGLPQPIDPARGTFIYSPTHRVNYDHTLTPTVLLHFGLGYTAENFWDFPPTDTYNSLAAQSCTSGSTVPGMTQTCTGGLGWVQPTPGGLFPQFVSGSGLFGAPGAFVGGLTATGPSGAIHSSGFSEHRGSANINASWVRGSHTYKAGWDWFHTQIPTNNLSNSSGTYTFGGSTVQPALQGVTLSAGSPTTGFGFADFLMGNMNVASLAIPADTSNRKSQTAFYVQDSWKISRKLTFDYGIRWDYGTYAREQYGRAADFSFTVPNPSAGGHPGGQIFESTCNCNFASNYGLAIGPRLGAAYQINSKTVIRGGVGLVYNPTGVFGGFIANTGSSPTLVTGQYLANAAGTPTLGLSQGLPPSVQIKWPDVNNPAAGQSVGAVVGAPTLLSTQSGRPGRVYQFNFTIQREITRNFVVEAAYVGNRAVWQPTGGFAAGLQPGPNDKSVALLAANGFVIPAPGYAGVTADSTLLRTAYTSLNAAQISTLQSRGIFVPYSTFPISGPTAQTPAQLIKPFPQYSTGPTYSGVPDGKSWYDALQTTITKRLSHGLSVNANYTYSKALSWTSSPDVYNPGLGKNLSTTDLPHQFRMSADYTTPKLKDGLLGKNKIISYILSDWGTGWFLQYQSAPIIGGGLGCGNLPSSSGTDPISNYLGRGTVCANQAVDANGKPISPWSVDWFDLNGTHHTDPLDINCKCFNPQTTQVLNPAAWTSAPNGAWSNSYSTIRDYRGFRVPTENVNFSRTFSIKERVKLTIRAEWANAFNRLRYSTGGPTGGLTFASTSFTTPLTCSGGGTCNANTGVKTGGFGSLVVPSTGTAGQRLGDLIMRLQF